jgi:aldose 1-epimerase
MVHPQPGYPFALDVAVEYALSEEGLGVRTTATNTGKETCPFGAGAHPYLTLGVDPVDPLLLRLPARTVIECDARGIPTGASAVEGTGYDFRKPQAIGPAKLDHAFADLTRADDGLARVELRAPGGDAGVALWVDDSYRYLMVFSGDGLPEVNRRSLAVEPMTCPPNAFRSGEALLGLEPGESFTGAWGLAAVT